MSINKVSVQYRAGTKYNIEQNRSCCYDQQFRNYHHLEFKFVTCASLHFKKAFHVILFQCQSARWQTRVKQTERELVKSIIPHWSGSSYWVHVTSAPTELLVTYCPSVVWDTHSISKSDKLTTNKNGCSSEVERKIKTSQVQENKY